jgi:hypothetical protein
MAGRQLSLRVCCGNEYAQPQGSTFEAQHGFIMEYYLIVISIACVKRKIIKLKYPVACSGSVGAAGERDL